MGTDMNKEIAALRRMTAGQLRARYRDLFGEESRSGNRDWLFRRCAWGVQTLAEGELSERARQRAQELTRETDIRLRPPKDMEMPRQDAKHLPRGLYHGMERFYVDVAKWI